MKVVVFGPTLEIKLQRQKRTNRDTGERLNQANPMMQKNIVRIMKPPICSGLRPTLSIRRIATMWPGMRPATERMRFPTPRLYSLSSDTVQWRVTVDKLSVHHRRHNQWPSR